MWGNRLAGAIVRHCFFSEKVLVLRARILGRALSHTPSSVPGGPTLKNKVGINKKKKKASQVSNAAYFNLFQIKQYMYIYIFSFSEKHQVLNSTKAHVSSADHGCLIGKFFFFFPNINSLKTINGLTSLLQHRLLLSL